VRGKKTAEKWIKGDAVLTPYDTLTAEHIGKFVCVYKNARD